jgi:hypothetical protein
MEDKNSRLIDAINGYKKAIEEKNTQFRTLQNLLRDRGLNVFFYYRPDNDDIHEISWDEFSKGNYRIFLKYRPAPGEEVIQNPWEETPIIIRLKASKYLDSFVTQYSIYLEDKIDSIMTGDI